MSFSFPATFPRRDDLRRRANADSIDAYERVVAHENGVSSSATPLAVTAVYADSPLTSMRFGEVLAKLPADCQISYFRTVTKLKDSHLFRYVIHCGNDETASRLLDGSV